jgi:hypothetical protein
MREMFYRAVRVTTAIAMHQCLPARHTSHMQGGHYRTVTVIPLSRWAMCVELNLSVVHARACERSTSELGGARDTTRKLQRYVAGRISTPLVDIAQ